MKLFDIVRTKRAHAERFANQSGAAGSSFDATSLPREMVIHLSNAAEVAAALPDMCFVKIKSANRQLQLTSVAEVLARAKSSNWQVSVQL